MNKMVATKRFVEIYSYPTSEWLEKPKNIELFKELKEKLVNCELKDKEWC